MIRRAESFISRIQTTNQRQPAIADLFFKNGRNRLIRIFNIGVVPETGFLTKGHLLIRLDGHPKVLEVLPNDLLDIKEFNTNYQEAGGLEFQNNSKLEVFAWNEIDGQQIGVTVSFIIGELI